VPQKNKKLSQWMDNPRTIANIQNALEKATAVARKIRLSMRVDPDKLHDHMTI
jgi:hypothetical protein